MVGYSSQPGPTTDRSKNCMCQFVVDRVVYGRLGQVINAEHPEYIERLSGPELEASIRAGFRAAECFAMLSKLNSQLRICRDVSKWRGVSNE